MLYEFSQEVYIGANISKSSRVPTIEELFSEGPHLAAYSYEIGNPELESESGIGTELFVYHNFDRLKFNLNLFRNDLSYYITPRNTGEINYATFLPVYKSFGVPAIFYGAEGKIDWEFVKDFNLSTTMSYTYGEFDETGDPLPQIPPLKGNIELTYTNSNFGAGVSSELAAAQNRTDQFEEETDGYVVFNSFIQYNFNTSSILHSFTLNFDNIFDTEYRNHLSRVKSILPEPGRNIRLIYKLFL
jgi:iron complex outermembrane receptor protein